MPIALIKRWLWRHPGHLIWVAVAYLPFLGKTAVPLTGDQRAYLNTALEMWEKGSWLKPFLFGEASYLKPPIQYWATLLSWKVLGISMFSSLFPSVLALLGTAWLLGEIARLLHEKRGFVDAGLWFAATIGGFTFGLSAQMEIWVCFFHAAAWAAALRYLSDPVDSRRARWLVGAFVLAGLSSLVKSPLYSVFWVVGFLSYLLVSGEWELFGRRHLYLAWLTGILSGAWWYLAILAVDGRRFVDQYVVYETFEKKWGNSGTASSLWLALLYFALPITPLLVPALRTVIRGRRTWPVLKFAVAWSWAPALFFTFYPFRVQTYLFILVPPLAVLVDWAFFRDSRSRGMRRIFTASGVAVGGGIAALALLFGRTGLAPPGLAWGLAAVGIWVGYCGFRAWERGFALAVLGALLIVRMTSAHLGEVDIQDLRAEVARLAASDAGDLTTAGKPRIALLDEGKTIWNESGWLTAALETRVQRLTSGQEAREFVRAGGLLLLSEEQDARLGSELGEGLVRKDWKRWSRRGQLKVAEILTGKQAFDAALWKRRWVMVGKG